MTTGHLKPERQLTTIFVDVVRHKTNGGYGVVKSGANHALLTYLETVDPDVLQQHLNEHGFNDLDDLQRHVENNQEAEFP